MGRRPSASLRLSARAPSATAVITGWLVRRFSPHAAGSGIPQVEAVLRGDLPPIPFRLIPVKFFGGLLAIGSGLALGHEGPTVQMGGSLAHLVGKIFGRGWADCRVLIAAGPGAGLGTAFNAPIAGAVFVLEELVQQFERRIAIAALGASATAIGVARLLLGDTPDFDVSGLGLWRRTERGRSIACSEPSQVSWLSPTTDCCSRRARPRAGWCLAMSICAPVLSARHVGALGWFAPGPDRRRGRAHPKRAHGRRRRSPRFPPPS